MTQETQVHLHDESFQAKERLLVSHGELSASTFRWDTGVAGLRVSNTRGSIVLLPFQGQQVWDAVFDGRTLTMRSMVDRPYPTRDYLATYGGFILHCGVTAMGVPTREDSHPLHGELPNAPYRSAHLALGSDERGPYLAVGGEYHHVVAFNDHYVARPLVKLRPGSAMIEVSLEIENKKRTPMEIMYLAHVNFRPVDNGKLVFSAPCTAQSVRVRTSIPPHVHPPAGFAEFLQDLARHPERHLVLVPGMSFDPEALLYFDYRADELGWARSIMIHPDGFSSCIRHRPSQLDHGMRWISRTPDQDCLGIVLPATAEPEGYAAEKRKGNVKTLNAGATIRWELEAGLLTPGETQDEERAIQRILARAG
jgi:hypothetical protein